MLSFMLSTSTTSSDKAGEFDQPLLRTSPNRLKLRTNFLGTLSGNVVYAACRWGILVVLAKLGTPQLVGEFVQALAITALIVVGAGLALRGVQATDAASEYPFGDYLLVRLLTTAAAGAVIVGIVCLSDYGWHTAAIILVVALAKAFESISDIFYPHLQSFKPRYRSFRPGDVRDSEADIGKAARLLGYEPAYTVQTGLNTALAWCRRNL